MAEEKTNGQGRAKQDEIIATLKKEWGRLVTVRTPIGLIVCRRPTPGEHQRVSDKYTDGKSKYAAQKEHVFACAVHPDIDRFKQILDDYPSLVQMMCDGLIEIAGANLEIETGK